MFGDFDYKVILASLPYLFGTGMVFTVTLTALAASGGIVLGTIIAMMRLSGVPFLVPIARNLRRLHAVAAAGAGDLLVLLPGALSASG